VSTAIKSTFLLVISVVCVTTVYSFYPWWRLMLWCWRFNAWKSGCIWEECFRPAYDLLEPNMLSINMNMLQLHLIWNYKLWQRQINLFFCYWYPWSILPQYVVIIRNVVIV
jgi:hypothetical protein